MKIDLRQWECLSCCQVFWVGCDADEYPTRCPYCGSRRVDKATDAAQTIEVTP